MYDNSNFKQGLRYRMEQAKRLQDKPKRRMSIWVMFLIGMVVFDLLLFGAYVWSGIEVKVAAEAVGGNAIIQGLGVVVGYLLGKLTNK